MECPDCGATAVPFAVPAEYRECLPAAESGVALCGRCLKLQPVAEPPAAAPDLAAISDTLPSDEGAAVPLALLLGLLENLALYRAEIDDLATAVERAGVDPLLVLERLAADPGIDAAADLRGRRRQLEQLR